jgi:hypothetical protein
LASWLWPTGAPTEFYWMKQGSMGAGIGPCYSSSLNIYFHQTVFVTCMRYKTNKQAKPNPN